MAKRFLLVAGNIGVGKTSLTDRLATRMGWQAAYESVADNPYLADFYADMQSWSFHLQIYFLGHRAEQHRRMALSPVSVIIDRSIYEDANIFARALYQMGNMSERDYLAYRRLFRIVVERLPPPDLLLFLDASVDTLLTRIRGRDRAIETGITADYLILLKTFYVDWMADFDLCPVLTIPADRLDFVHHPDHLDVIVDRIQQKLAGKEIVVFD